MKLNNKFAIGCLVQFYEIDIIKDYLLSVKKSLDIIENKENVIVEVLLNLNEGLEQIDTNKKTLDDIKSELELMLKDIFSEKHNLEFKVNDVKGREGIYTIADYRRDFNNEYCEQVDVLMWGESDSLIPTQTWYILDSLHNNVKEETPKYVSFFSTCKMWDDTWKVLEHPDFTDKPFIEMDTENWWSLRYNMSQKEMDDINEKTTELEIKQTKQLKFNGCGLVISSDVIKSGANIHY